MSSLWKISLLALLAAVPVFVGISCWNSQPAPEQQAEHESELKRAETAGLQKATFGTGCFWCTEAIFQELKGVSAVVSGFSGGETENPTYKQVSKGETGHAEVVQITFDPALITYEELLQVFWKTHDPTTLNRQGNDIGPQYRSAIFFHNDEQRRSAEYFKTRLNEMKAFNAPVVTEITPFQRFYPADVDQQNFHKNNGWQPYCRVVIAPKLKKFRAAFAEKLKK